MCLEIIVAIVVVVLIIWLVYPSFEGFEYHQALAPMGAPQYGLRGERLKTGPISQYYISPHRQIRLSQSNADMWDSDYTPTEQGMKGCYRSKCPSVGFDNQDTCWKCKTKEYKMRIPDVWPHVAV
jgi:hypothetical protein